MIPVHYRSSSLRQRGGTATGFLVGVVVGLVIAAATAVFVARAPLPFMDKDVSVDVFGQRSPQGGLPDPNVAMRAKTSEDPALNGVVQAPGTTSTPPPVTGNAVYSLQAGAFRRLADAESMRARLALMGFEAEIQQALVNDETVYRVRVGPYVALDTMNLARAELAGGGIEVSVVRQ